MPYKALQEQKTVTKNDPGSHSEELSGAWLGWTPARPKNCYGKRSQEVILSNFRGAAEKGGRKCPKQLRKTSREVILNNFGGLGWGRTHGRARNNHEKHPQGILLSHFWGLAGGGPRRAQNSHDKRSQGTILSNFTGLAGKGPTEEHETVMKNVPRESF